MTATKWTDAETAAIFPQLEEIIVSLPDLNLSPIDVNKGGEGSGTEASASAETGAGAPGAEAVTVLTICASPCAWMA